MSKVSVTWEDIIVVCPNQHSLFSGKGEKRNCVPIDPMSLYSVVFSYKLLMLFITFMKKTHLQKRKEKGFPTATL